MAEQQQQKVENASVTSTTNEPSAPTEQEAPSKEFYRKQVLRKMRKEKSTASKSFQIPIFVDIEKANELLAQTEEFKKAQNIKINFDRPQKGVFIEALKANKTLFLSGDRKSVALLDKVDGNALKLENQEIDEKSIGDIFRSKSHKTEVPLTDKTELDLVVIGSIAVGKDGRRIGNENGFNDLELGILTHIGAITDKTLIVTTVHDDQIVDDLKSDIFEKFDYPVDIIVTPTQVLKVEKRLPRPEGIYWELLNERRVDASPTLLQLKTEAINAGKTITLKPVSEEDEKEKKLRRKRRSGFGTRPRMPNYRRKMNKSRQNSSAVASNKVSENLEDVATQKEKPITKHLLRDKVWIHIKENKLAEKAVYKKIPIFENYEKAIAALTNLDEFKKSENIYTTNDLVFQPLKLSILKEKKGLYTPVYTGENVLAKVKPVEEGQETTIEYVDSILSEKKFDLINMNNKVELDLVVLGSVLVSKDGRRIGNANRITDLSFGYLVELGFITPKTKIVTLVHECQLQEIPENLLTVYDIPVDFIITPTEVIKVENPPTRPTGILWDHITERQLENSAVLQALKQKKEAAGETVTIKPKNHRERPARNERRRRTKLGSGNRTKRTTETSEVSEGDRDARPTNERRRNRRVGNSRRRLGRRNDKIVDEQLTNDLKKTLRNRTRPDAYCVRVSNITPGIQAKEFKTEIRKLASPTFVNWNGKLRSCTLHFNRKTVDNNEEGGIDNILRALENLSIDIATPEGETKTLSKMGIKLLPDKNFLESNDISRIESVDSTTV